MTPPEAAARAWLAIVRRGFGNRSLADGLIEIFDVGADRTEWQRFVDSFKRTAGYEPFCAAACARFDLMP